MLPHWPKVGVGDTLQAQLEQDALSSPQWASVQRQLGLEGITSPSSIHAVESTFTSAYTSLIAPANGFGLASDPGSALDAAKQLTIVGQTALGAVTTVSGLIHDLSSETPQQIMQSFTGGLVALAVGAGAVSAGIGAAIMVGVGALLDVMGKAGLFGAPVGVQLQGCPGAYYDPPPTMAVGCVAGYCDPNIVQVSPASTLWRSFPKPGDSTDAPWFSPLTEARLGSWKNVEWWWPSSNSAYATGGLGRPIDAAFPNYNWVERGAASQGISFSSSPFLAGSRFMKGFAAAWRANAEYALNGLKPSDDTSVLLQFLRFWNRAHGGPTFTMYQGGQGSYAESLVTSVVGHITGGGEDAKMLSSDGGLLVNIGDLKQAVAAPSNEYHGTLVSSSTPSGLSTGGKVAVGASLVGGAALVGSAIYAYAKKEALSTVWSEIFKRAKFW